MVQQFSSNVPQIVRRAASPDDTAPDGSEIRLLIGRGQEIARASLCEVTLPAGQVSRPVWHRTVEEVWYVLQGQGKVWRCPPDAANPKAVEPVDVQAGDALAIPTGWRFQFQSAPAQALRFLCYTTPPWPGPHEAQPADYGGLGDATV